MSSKRRHLSFTSTDLFNEVNLPPRYSSNISVPGSFSTAIDMSASAFHNHHLLALRRYSLFYITGVRASDAEDITGRTTNLFPVIVI